MTTLAFERFEAMLGFPIPANERQVFELVASGTRAIERLARCRWSWLECILTGASPDQREQAKLLMEEAAEYARVLLGPGESTGPLGLDPSIDWELYDAKRVRPFAKDEKQYLEAVNWINKALRLTLQLREEFLLGCLAGRDPADLERIGERAISTAEKARMMMALEDSDPEMWRQIQDPQERRGRP